MRYKVLTVDDSKTVRIIVRKAFKPYDCEILEAANGVEGLAIRVGHGAIGIEDHVRKRQWRSLPGSGPDRPGAGVTVPVRTTLSSGASACGNGTVFDPA